MTIAQQCRVPCPCASHGAKDDRLSRFALEMYVTEAAAIQINHYKEVNN